MSSSIVLPLTLIPFEPWHLPRIEVSHETRESFNGFGSSPEELLLTLNATTAKCMTFVDQSGIILGICGAMLMFHGPGGGCARVFVVPGVASREVAVPLVRLAKKMCDSLAQQWGLHRIEAVVYSRFKSALRLARAVGFEVEGLMRSYDLNGRDYFLVSKLYGG